MDKRVVNKLVAECVIIINKDNMPSREPVPAEPEAVGLPKCFRL